MPKLFSAATDMALRAGHSFKTGKVPSRALNALLDSIKDAIGVERGGFFPNPKEYPITGAGSTAQVAKASAARVYGFRAVSGLNLTSTLDVVVQILDGSVVIGSCKLTSEQDCEVYFYGKDGIGILALTNVSVKAVAIADGSSDPAAGDKPTVIVLAS